MNEKIVEPALEDESLLAELRNDPALLAAYGMVPSGKSRLKAPIFDMERVWKLMEGAIDVHIHPGPDAYNARVYDEFEIAKQASKFGMRAVVYKGHSMQSARSAYFIKRQINSWAEQNGGRKIDVRGGVTLNYTVGGLNPEAVLTSYRIGGRHVWLPNKDASFHHKLFGIPGGIDVIDEHDQPVQPLREILKLIAEGDMVLSLSHQGVKERFIIIDEALKIGVKRIEVCHPLSLTAKMTVKQMKIAADKGVFLGMYCANFDPKLTWSWDGFMEAYKVIGAEHIVLGTDCGHFAFPSPIEAMRLFVTGMLTRGIPDEKVERMLKINPDHLLY